MRLVFCALALLAALTGALYLSASDEPLLKGIEFGTVITDRSGNLLRAGLAADDKYRYFVPLDQIAPAAVAATLEYEDKWFYRHPGVNIFALPRACVSLFSGRRIGASTLTMQVARLRYRLRTNTAQGKLAQIALALAMELRHTKREILEAYFNLAPYGGNVEGIEAASQIYFHKHACALTEEEATSLAVVPQNPAGRNPAAGRDYHVARKRSGSLSPLAIYSTADLPFGAPHLCLELTSANRGAKVAATLDTGMQKMLERHISGYVERNARRGIANACALILRWTDMEVLALAGSASFGNAVIAGQVDGTRARRSPGSTLKPFIYALALEQGLIHPFSILPDAARSFGGYDPENFDRGFRGPIAAGDALRESRNLPAIYLAERLGNPDLYEFLRSANVEFEKDAAHYGLALVLGGAEVTMRELAGLYAMLANRGLWQPLRFIRGDTNATARRLLSPEAAWLALAMLKKPGASIRSRGRETPLLYKTGTSNGFRDAWTIGIAGEYVLAVWTGNFDGRPDPVFVGARAALPLFEELAQALGSRIQLADAFTEPPPELRLAGADICAATGDLYKGQCAATVRTWIIPGVSPTSSGILRSILLDETTGLRACAASSGPVRQVWWEFWPSDLKQIFARAGVAKPDPPEWSPECREQVWSTARKPPEIRLPKKGVAYLRRFRDADFRIPLSASADAEAGRIHWYADSHYVGSSRPGEIIYWQPVEGTALIRAVDDQGASSTRKCRIAIVP